MSRSLFCQGQGKAYRCWQRCYQKQVYTCIHIYIYTLRTKEGQFIFLPLLLFQHVPLATAGEQKTRQHQQRRKPAVQPPHPEPPPSTSSSIGPPPLGQSCSSSPHRVNKARPPASFSAKSCPPSPHPPPPVPQRPTRQFETSRNHQHASDASERSNERTRKPPHRNIPAPIRQRPKPLRHIAAAKQSTHRPAVPRLIPNSNPKKKMPHLFLLKKTRTRKIRTPEKGRLPSHPLPPSPSPPKPLQTPSVVSHPFPQQNVISLCPTPLRPSPLLVTPLSGFQPISQTKY